MMSSFTALIQVFKGLPRCLRPTLTCISKHLIGAADGLLITWSYHVSRLSLILSSIGAIPRNPFILSFLILSLRVLPHIHLNIRISVTDILCVCSLLVAQHSVPYSIVGRTIIL